MGLRRSGKEQVDGWTFWSGLRCENTCVPHACSAGAPADRWRRPIPRMSTSCSPAHTVHGQSASSSTRVSPHGLDDLHLPNHGCCHAFRCVSQQLRPTQSREPCRTPPGTSQPSSGTWIPTDLIAVKTYLGIVFYPVHQVSTRNVIRRLSECFLRFHTNPHLTRETRACSKELTLWDSQVLLCVCHPASRECWNGPL